MLNKVPLKHLTQTINEQLHTEFILLFGSFAKGTAREDSNVDLAYFSNHNLSSSERFTLAGDLAAIADREVDLVNLKQIDSAFTKQIFSESVPIYLKDLNEFTRQKIRSISMYAIINKERFSIFSDTLHP